MDNATRRELLCQYRRQREATMANPVGEATGRTYITVPEELAAIGRQAPLDVHGYVTVFGAMLAYSPVVVRRGELLVGDYYFMLPGEIIPMHCPLDFGPYYAIGAQPVPASGHTVVNAARGLALGWQGMLDYVAQCRQRFVGGTAEAEYLDGAAGIINHIQQRIRAYAAEAERLAAGVEGEEAEEYRAIAARCARLAMEAPQSLHDALQWYWFYVTCERATASGMGSIRLDQVFYSCYQRDMAAGLLDDARAQMLFEALLLKEPLFASIGGLTPEGKDAVNRLTWLILDAYDAVGGPSNLALRINPLNDPALLERAAKILARHGTGVPHLVNDEAVIPSLLHFGFPPEEANDYCFAGCFWWAVPGKEYTYHDFAGISGMRPLLRALQELRGRASLTFADVWAAYDRYLDEAVEKLIKAYNIIDPWLAQHHPEMVVSLLMDDTLPRGRDFQHGGTTYSHMTVQYVGLPNVADSLYTIKTLVCERATCTLDELMTALERNFAGDEDLLAQIRALPKYGNDETKPDLLAAEVATHYKLTLASYRNGKGFRLRPAFYAWHRHTYEGQALGATPDGRLAGKPLAHGANPSHGQAKAGVTAAILSMTHLVFSDTAGCPIHIHLSGGSPELRRTTILSLTQTAFALGAVHLIVNVVDGQILRAAMAAPDQYSDLTIRITGYSARYVHLERQYQEEIAARNEYWV